MSKEKAFGIGCFHFGVKKIEPFQFKGSEYINELEKVLSKIPNLNNLVIKTDDKFEAASINITEKLPNLEKNIGFFPKTLFFNLEFEIYIPFRIQKEICLGLSDTYSENFKVTIMQGFHSPVTIVETINPTETPNPSTAVMLIREFIKKEINNKSEYIRFECIGPSPFHMDCHLKPQKTIDKDKFFDTEEIISRGYSKFIINYNENKFNNSDKAFDYLKYSMCSEFSFFYHYIQVRNSEMRSWETIQENLEKLKQIQETLGIKGLYKKIFKRPFLIERLITDLTTFESQNIMDKGISQNQYLQVYPSKNVAFFKTFIDKELKERIDYPIKQVTSLIRFIENRHARSSELFIILISAILGGLIGSIITIYFQQPI